jgi:hypothetical protein
MAAYWRNNSSLVPISVAFGTGPFYVIAEYWAIQRLLMGPLFVGCFLVSFLFLYSVNVLLVCRFGRRELRDRIRARWTEILVAAVERRQPVVSCDDAVDRVAMLYICVCRIAYWVGILDEVRVDEDTGQAP